MGQPPDPKKSARQFSTLPLDGIPHDRGLREPAVRHQQGPGHAELTAGRRQLAYAAWAETHAGWEVPSLHQSRYIHHRSPRLQGRVDRIGLSLLAVVVGAVVDTEPFK